MQTGSGISHQEEMYGEQTEFFQIWFEPNMSASLRKPPVYSDFEDAEFPRETLGNGITAKHIIGPSGVIELQAPINWDVLQIRPKASYSISLAEHSLAGFIVTRGSVQATIGDEERRLSRRDFVMIKTESSHSLTIQAIDEDAELTLITAPIDPGYSLINL